MQSSVSQIILLADPFWLRNITTDPHILAHVNMSGFFYATTATNRPGPPHYRGFTIKLRHTALGRTHLDQWSARRTDLYLTAHNTHKRHPCPSGIRNRNPRKRALAAPRFTPRDHRDGVRIISIKNSKCISQD